MTDLKTASLKEFAGFVADQLSKQGIETVLVGGACVTIYSNNRYQSFDLDFVIYEDMKTAKRALETIGFKEKNGCFYYPGCIPLVIQKLVLPASDSLSL